uniref:Uncharacterized protein n=1 Tax=Arundo donax TaxID=35708 RepID=A0A0A9GSG7_ARUDO
MSFQMWQSPRTRYETILACPHYETIGAVVQWFM